MDVLKFRNTDTFKGSFPFNINRHTDGEFRQPLHAHDYIQIAYVVQGVCSHWFQGKLLTVGKGDIFLIPPGITHSICSLPNKGYEVVLIDFLPFFVHDEMRAFSHSLDALLTRNEEGEGASRVFQPWLHIDGSKQILVDQLLLDLQEEFTRREEGYEFSIRINLIKLLILMDREYRRMKEPQSPAQAALCPSNPMKAAVRYIQNHYNRDLPLEEGAEAAGMAPAYFSHKFKKETGLTFVEYLNEVRITQAKALLSKGDEPVTQICYRVGFRHLSHFNRTFKKRTGLTPTEYKKAFTAAKN
ncbi:AraC family transcriptional regulator [Paenibacillus aurantius]|uniref:AraC family transcriptional regulator n=1 Tax=Paenibacillus aurantius TaxID=2918900 RepID=A0AA96L8N7_9BACL|nr:AraC family transcriptional regulator [Paenibacillus aurantius]WNQ09052.1 AraC family transcriptional regulator [Paenibacillus aurantius]